MNARSRQSEASRPNSLGLSERALVELLDEFDQQGGGSHHAARSHVRRSFAKATVHVKFKHPGGQTSVLKLACRNLSRGGMALLHRSFVNPGTQLAVVLPHNFKGPTVHEGVVVRCEHRGSMLHELGVQFKREIDIRDYVQMDPFGDCYSLESVDPDRLQGRMVYLDDSELDRRIVQHFLRGTQVSLRPATTIDEAMTLVHEGCDLVLADFHLRDGESAGNLVNDLRAEGNNTPVILITSDTSPETRLKMLAARADAYLTKPVDQSILHRAIAEFLLSQRGEDSNDDEQVGAPPALIREYVSTLGQEIAHLESAIESDDYDACRRTALRIYGSAPSLGLARLGGLAKAAADALDASMSVSESSSQVRALIDGCKAAAGS